MYIEEEVDALSTNSTQFPLAHLYNYKVSSLICTINSRWIAVITCIIVNPAIRHFTTAAGTTPSGTTAGAGTTPSGTTAGAGTTPSGTTAGAGTTAPKVEGQVK